MGFVMRCLRFTAVAVSVLPAGANVPAPPPAKPSAAGPVLAATTFPAQLHELIKRQATTTTENTYTLTIAPDETCGFLSGSVGVPITCASRRICTWESEFIDAVICGTEFEVYLRCLERDVAINTVSCNDVCQSNIYNLRW
jgi:hypothetical protein